MPESFPPRLADLMKRYFSSWEIMELLGEGSYAKVYKIRRSGTDEMCALKWISYTGDQVEQDMQERGASEQNLQDHCKLIKENLENEITLQNKLSYCDNIVMLYNGYHYTDVRPDNTFDILICMELLTPIKAIAQQLTVKEVIRLGKDICAALETCRQEGILHLDIKPENIFRDKKGHYKLGDFGSATYRNSKRVLRRGTPLYMAPEMGREQGCIDSRADLYALGLVMYELLNAQLPPFVEPPKGEAVSPEMEQAAIEKRNTGAELPMPRQANADLGGIVLKACAFDVNERFANAEIMLEALNNLNDDAQEYEERLEAYQPSQDSGVKQQARQENPDETSKALPRDTQRIYSAQEEIKQDDKSSDDDLPKSSVPPAVSADPKPNPYDLKREKWKKLKCTIYKIAAGVLITGLAVLIVILGMNGYNAYQAVGVAQQQQAYVLTWKNGGSGPWNVEVIRNGNVVIQQDDIKERKTELTLTPGYEYQININGEARCSFSAPEWPAYHGDELEIQRMDCYSYNVKKDIQLQDYNYTNKEKYIFAGLNVGEEGHKGYMLKGTALLPEGITKEIDVYLVADVGGMEKITVSVTGEKLIDGKQINPSYFRISLNEFIQEKAMQATSITCKLYADGEVLPINKVIEVRSSTEEE